MSHLRGLLVLLAPVMRVLALAGLIGSGVLLGCTRDAVPIPSTSPEEVAVVRDAFPLFIELGLQAMWVDDDCHYISYGRGAFSREAPTLLCDVVGNPAPVLIDAQAEADIARVRGQLASLGEVQYVAIRYDVGLVATGTFLDLSECTTLVYEPGYTHESMVTDLDDERRAVAIDADWYELQACQ